MEWKLLESGKLGSKTAKNKIVMPPMETRLSTITGDVTTAMIDYYAERAKGGAGTIIVENTCIDNKASRGSLSSSALYSDHLIAGKNLLAEAIKDRCAIAIIQLGHSGRQAKAGVTGYDAVAPSQVMCSVTKRVPHVLNLDEIAEIEDDFAAAACRAKQAGFDGVEVHGAHGYLVCSFLSPFTNLRDDIYGGSAENRGRFAANILKKIREKTGKDFIVGYRISASEYIEGGLALDDAACFVASIQKDIDYIHVSAGIYESPGFSSITPTYVKAGQLVPLAAKMKKAVDIPVIAVGAISPEMGEEILSLKEADFIAMGRALIADPYLPKKLAEGRRDEVRPCIRGNEGCISRFHTGCTIRCEINPAAGQELAFSFKKAVKPKKVLVAGGGAAGMEAARLASLSGHVVTLAEKEAGLGGHLVESTRQDFKKEESAFFNWLVSQVKKSGARVLLNTFVTPAFVREQNPDILILALGSEYGKPGIKGAEFTVTAGDILKDTSVAGEKVAVIGGGLAGAETALALGLENRKVTLIEMTGQVAAKHEPGAASALVKRLAEAGVEVYLNHTVEEISPSGVKARDRSGNIIFFEAGTIVLATGMSSNRQPELQGLAPLTFSVGDCVEPGKIYNCMHQAWKAVKDITEETTIS